MSTEGAFAAHADQGGRKQSFNQSTRDLQSWFEKVPGLFTEIELLAWNHRGESPFIHVMTSPNDDDDGSGVQVKMLPRKYWDKDPRFLHNFSDAMRVGLRQAIGASSFCADKTFMQFSEVKHHGKRTFGSLYIRSFGGQISRGVAIVEALTAGARDGDLADAFNWFENVYPPRTAREMMEWVRHRSSLLHGGTMPLGSSVPIPTTALNTEVAYMMMSRLHGS